MANHTHRGAPPVSVRPPISWSRWPQIRVGIDRLTRFDRLSIAAETTVASRVPAPLVMSLLLLATALMAVAGSTSVSAVWGTLRQFTVLTALQIAAVTAVSILVGAIRLQILLRALGHHPTIVECLRVVAVSQAAATMFFQIVGQIGSRSVLMSKQGIPVPSTVFVTLTERVIGLAMLLVLSLGGAVILFGGVSIDMRSGGAEFILLGVGLAAAISMATLLCGREVAAASSLEMSGLPSALLKAGLATLMVQACTLTAFCLSARAFAPEASVIGVAAASTIVMLASAMPISFGGWGIRELGAVFALGAIGIGADAAFSAALVIGIIGLGVVLALSALPLPARHSEPASPKRQLPALDAMAALGWGLPLLAAVLVLFQVHAPVGSGRLNVNFADPAAIVAGAMVLAGGVSVKVALAVPRLGRCIALAWAALLLALFHGWMSFGSNGWAVTKAWGFLVLAAYGLTGALVVTIAGGAGRDILLRCLAASFLGVALLTYVQFLLNHAPSGLGLPIMRRAEGFAQDANAFAFQAIVVLAVVVTSQASDRLKAAIIGSAVLAVWLSGSRSGLAALAAVAGLAVVLERSVWRSLAKGAGLAAIALALPLVTLLPWPTQSRAIMQPPSIAAETQPEIRTTAPAVSPVGRSGAAPPWHTYALEARSFSNAERLLMLQWASAKIQERPILGQGLGAFVGEVRRADGSPLVLHSTYLWLLAELGIVGFLAFMTPAAMITHRAWRQRRAEPAGRLILLVMLGWGLMSLVQDLAYQRIAWLVLGAALATVPGERACREPEVSRPG